jgi:hypothetical protein
MVSEGVQFQPSGGVELGSCVAVFYEVARHVVFGHQTFDLGPFGLVLRYIQDVDGGADDVVGVASFVAETKAINLAPEWIVVSCSDAMVDLHVEFLQSA